MPRASRSLPLLLAWLVGCGGQSCWLRQYEGRVEHGTAVIARATTDHERALGYTERARGLGEKARYLRAFGKLTLPGYVAIFDQARGDHDTAVRLDPASAEAYVGRGLTEYDRGFPAPPDALETEAEVQRHRLLARSDFAKAIELDAANETALDRRGLIEEQAKEYEDAIRDYTALATVSPRLGRSRLADAHCRRGGEHAAARRFEPAIADYERAIGLDAPSDGCDCEPYGSVAAVYVDAGRYDDAWKAVHLAREKRRWVPDELVARLAKVSGRDH